ncbi:MAG TPA: DUF5681 domain-containing protein [Xanthobacteraceae bacterium]|nr:DUF5681 domain-containing protein [Xanthobacteraceae bacterium]
MAWKTGESGNPIGKKPGTLKEKPYRDALRMEIAAAEDFKDLRSIARAHLEKARSGDIAAIKELADRLDGKPAQESMVTIEHKRNATDWTRAELVAFLNDTLAGSKRVAETDGSDREADSIH